MPSPVSLCVIAKNEEHNLGTCLASAADLVREIIVVDTGSTDKTKEVARAHGAKVFDFAWVDDFAAARNESIRHATGEWIFWLDADDRIDASSKNKLRALFASLPDDNVAYAMTYHDGCSAVARVCLFRNHPEIRWSYRVHEQILPAVERLGGRAQATDVIVHTVGYHDPGAVQCKLQRNLRLLRLEISDRPGDLLTEWNLGRTTLRLGLFEEAAHWLQRCLARVGTSRPFFLPLAYGQLAEALCRMRRFQDALTCCQDGRSKFPNDLPLMLAEGVVLAELGDPREAELRLEDVIRRDPGNGMARAWLARLRPVGRFDIGR
jgi:glycosyltransferase involved in cell wall biosynthesis